MDMSSTRGRPRAAVVPPMGQGLAVIAVLIAAAVFAAVGVGGYLLSLHVAAAKAEVSRLDARTEAGRADIRRLQRDIEIRSRLPELDRWRAPLALAPASADQFATGSGTLLATAEARRRALDAGRPAPAPARTPSYTDAARGKLDALIDAVTG